jgi:hypothetical protein
MRLDSLIRSITVPLTLAAVALVVAAAPLQEARELRVYDVSLLVEPVRDHPGPSLQIGARKTGKMIWGEQESPEAPFDADGLVDLITGSIEPDSWRHDAVRCEVAGTTLQVIQSPGVQTQVKSFLTRLRRDVGAVVEVEVSVWRATPAQARALQAASPGRTGTFPAKGATTALAAMQGAERLDRATVALRSGQRAHAAALRERTYIGDIEVEVAEKSKVGDPITFSHRLGLVADLKCIPSRDGRRVMLESRLAWAELERIDRKTETAFGDVELPERRVTSILGLASLAYGEEWCGAATANGGKAVVFVLSARRRLPAGGGNAKDPEGGRRVTRVYGIAGLTFRAFDFPGPNLTSNLTPGAGGAAGGMVFGDDEAEEGVRLDPEAVTELIRSNLDPDSWDHPRNTITYRGQSLLVTHTPEMQKEVVALLARLEASRPPALRVESVLVQPDVALDGLIDGRNGGTLADEAVSNWLAGAGARIEAYASLTGQNKQLVSAAIRHSVPAVGDWDVEVASSASAEDPIVRVALEGFVLSAQPLLSGDGATVSLRLAPERAFITRPIRVVETQHGPVELMEPSHHEAGMTPVVQEKTWAAQRFGRNAQGKPLVLLTSVRRTP